MDLLDWERHVQACRDSGGSIRGYAREHGLVYHRLMYRMRTWSEPSEGSMPLFIPVTLAAKASEGTCLAVVEFPGGTRVIIHSPELVPELVRTLMGRG
jgi:transposase-like protein